MALIVEKTPTGREYKVTSSLHMTIQTAVRIETLTALGAGKYEKKMYEKKEKRTDKYEKKVYEKKEKRTDKYEKKVYEKKDKRTGKYEKKVYEKKEKSAGKYEKKVYAKKVAGLHLGKLGAKLTILIPVEGPYKPAHYRY